MIIILNLLFLMVNIEGSQGEVISTLGYQLTKNGREFQNNQGKKFSISESCKQIEIGNPDLNSKVDSNSYYFLVKLTCNDIVDDEEFFNQERDVGNSTIEKKGTSDLSPYQCTLNVTLDNSEHCCCPERKKFSIKNPELTAIIIIPILTFFLLIGGCLFCLKQKIKKAEYIIIEQ